MINDDFVYVGALQHQEFKLLHTTLPDPRSIGLQLKDMGYVKYTVGITHKGPKIGGKERAIYYRPGRVLPSDFMPIVTMHITDCPL